MASNSKTKSADLGHDSAATLSVTSNPCSLTL